jgi:hypothetical protein
MARTPSGSPPSSSHWPTLERQLADAKVIHGSALEALIRANQDFSMLRPEEASDRLGLPPWIRVYWRKKHPDANYSGPSGGYPLVLKDYYEWMKDHQDLPTQVGPESPSPDGRQDPGERRGR